MRFLIAFACTAALTTVFARPLRCLPVLFYGIALVLDGAYAFGMMQGFSGTAWLAFAGTMQRCTLAFLLFSVVMFTGVLADGSRIKAHLLPLRRQLSILACLLVACHVGFYASSYLSRILAGGGGLSGALLFSLALALALAILGVVLMATSFVSVRARMKPSTWKTVQRCAYPFYLVTSVHVLLALMPSALAQSATATGDIVFYSTVALAYLVLRLRRWAHDRRQAKADRSEAVAATSPA